MQSSNALTRYLAPILTGKRVAILGLAREGISTYICLRSLFPELHLVLLDKAGDLPESLRSKVQVDAHVTLALGKEYLDGLQDVDVIFKTPGIPSLLTPIQDALSRGAYLTSQTDIFFALFGKQTIAVTGTKGKSTACKVLTHVLTSAGRHVLFIGNIGRPAFDVIDELTDEALVVYETSSHQCEGLRHSPHIAVFLNLFQDHLDYYPSVALYGQAKRQLFINLGKDDLCVYNAGDENVVKLLEDVRSKRLGFSYENAPFSSLYVENDQILLDGISILPTNKIPLLGKHNILNIMPAIIVAKELNIAQQTLVQGLTTVTPVEKRLETIGSADGITFIDDALATIPEATIAGLDALGNSVETLIVGGFDRGQDFVELSKAIATSSIHSLILFPTTGEKIASLVKLQSDTISFYPVTSMSEAVTTALRVTGKGKSVLLSTASASFGLFTDYRDRSAQYHKAIQEAGE